MKAFEGKGFLLVLLYQGGTMTPLTSNLALK